MKHTLRIFLVSLVLVLAFSGIASATVITVPGDQPTIQQGLDAAQEGDTVLVAPGTYYEVIFWPATNGIKLLSAAGAESTTIDATNDSSVIHFPGLGGIDTTTVLRGFRITNGGNVSYGGGIYMTQSSPIIEQCVVDSNNAGGGICCNNASNPIIRFCTISQNSGGGIAFNNSSAGLVDSCTISGNSAGAGGGIFCRSYSNPTVRNCTISGNSAEGDWGAGGGIYCSYSSPTVTNCTISGNSAGGAWGAGGGIYCGYFSSPTLTNCTISGNSAGGDWGHGGGISCEHSSNPTLTNCTISGNSVGGAGGGIYCYDSSPTLTNCTISGNSAGAGGGIYCLMRSSPIIKNCTITDNRASIGDGICTDLASWPTLDSNNICYNGYGVYNNDFSQFLQAPNHWWGHASGPYHPDHNPGGQGDSVSSFVYPLPYLTEADTIAPPIPPVGLDTLEVGYDYISLVWLASPIGDLAGYKVYSDSDSSGFPYLDTIDVGMDTTCTLDQLSTGTTYYIAVTCYDNSGNESWYSREIHATLRVRRGDANGDGEVNIADAIYLVNYLFTGGTSPDPLWVGDANCDGAVNIADVIYLLNYLFTGGPPPGCP